MIIFPAPDATVFSDTVLSIEGLLLGLDIDGVMWTFDDVAGWWLGGSVESTFTPRPGTHGMFDGPAYRRARVLTVPGTCVADSSLLAGQAADVLASVLADGSMGTLAVAGPQGVRTVQVRLSGSPQSSWVAPTALRWQLQFTAPDHRKYGDQITATTPLPGGSSGLTFPLSSFFDFGAPPTMGTVTVTNTGTAPTEPVFSVVGPLVSGFQLTHTDTGRRLRYESPVSTDPVVVDCLEGTVTSGGQDRTGLLTVDEFFTIGAGATDSFQFSSLGPETSTDPARATVTVAPAYF